VRERMAEIQLISPHVSGMVLPASIRRTAVIQLMSPHVPEAITRIYEVLQEKGVKVARAEYEKEFKIPVTDKRIDGEIGNLFKKALVSGSESWLPFRIGLALFLRPGGGARSVGALRELPWSSKARVVGHARDLMEKGYTARKAAQAAKEAEPGSPITVDQIVERLGHPLGRKRKPKPV
jgi:hypothetical protein